jgi:hypothetical protein
VRVCACARVRACARVCGRVVCVCVCTHRTHQSHVVHVVLLEGSTVLYTAGKEVDAAFSRRRQCQRLVVCSVVRCALQTGHVS